MKFPEVCESLVVIDGSDVKAVRSTDVVGRDTTESQESRSDSANGSERGETTGMASFSAIRDFFLTAFCDGYQSVSASVAASALRTFETHHAHG